MPDQEKPKGRLGLVATILASGAAGVAIALGVIELRDRLAPPGPELSIASTYGPFALPGHVMIERDQPTPNDGTIELPSPIPPREISGYIELSIKNTCDRFAEDVSVRCDYEGFFEVRRETGDDVDGTFAKKVSIGRIDQDEEVSLSLWTFEEVSPDTTLNFNHKLGTLAYQFPSEWDEQLGASRGFLFLVAAALAVLCVQLQKRLKQTELEAAERGETISRLIEMWGEARSDELVKPPEERVRSRDLPSKQPPSTQPPRRVNDGS